MKDVNYQVAVVCPIYKSYLTDSEQISLNSGFKLTAKYNFFIVCPESLEIKLPKKENLQIIKFENKYFKNINSYNKLLTSLLFYKNWVKYKYILIYQLDCYCFHDDLSFWINKNYDYVGAPWFNGFDKANKNSKIIGVGNGGLSLRKVDSFVKILNRKIKLLDLKYFLNNSNDLLLFIEYYIKNLLRIKILNEDFFWCKIVPKIDNSFRISSIEDAIKFSFEANPDVLYNKNNNQLPFGCHAFGKYNLDFWKEFIAELPTNNCFNDPS